MGIKSGKNMFDIFGVVKGFSVVLFLSISIVSVSVSFPSLSGASLTKNERPEEAEEVMMRKEIAALERLENQGGGSNNNMAETEAKEVELIRGNPMVQWVLNRYLCCSTDNSSKNNNNTGEQNTLLFPEENNNTNEEDSTNKNLLKENHPFVVVVFEEARVLFCDWFLHNRTTPSDEALATLKSDMLASGIMDRIFGALEGDDVLLTPKNNSFGQEKNHEGNHPHRHENNEDLFGTGSGTNNNDQKQSWIDWLRQKPHQLLGVVYRAVSGKRLNSGQFGFVREELVLVVCDLVELVEELLPKHSSGANNKKTAKLCETLKNDARNTSENSKKAYSEPANEEERRRYKRSGGVLPLRTSAFSNRKLFRLREGVRPKLLLLIAALMPMMAEARRRRSSGNVGGVPVFILYALCLAVITFAMAGNAPVGQGSGWYS